MVGDVPVGVTGQTASWPFNGIKTSAQPVGKARKLFNQFIGVINKRAIILLGVIKRERASWGS